MSTFFDKGAFSEVKIGVEKETGHQYAIKIIDRAKCKGKENMIETEVNILKRVRHENIIQLYDMFEVGGKIYLVMELVTGGELFDDIVGRGKYTEKDAARIIHKILSATDYLHCMGIVHRDLKPENLLLSDKTKNAKIMISDFGLSKIFNDAEVMKTACGTPGYVAPEVLKRQGYGKEVDLWSLGVITYILLCGYPPFYDPNNVELFKKIMAGKYEFDRPWWDNVSETARDFIRKLLLLDTKKRATAIQALNHPFIVEHCGHTETAAQKFSREASGPILTGIPPVSVSPQFVQPPRSVTPINHPPTYSYTAVSPPSSAYQTPRGSSSGRAAGLGGSAPPSNQLYQVPLTPTNPSALHDPNLAPTISANLHRVQSQKALAQPQPARGVTSRPLGNKTALHDSAYTSHEGLSQQQKYNYAQAASSGMQPSYVAYAPGSQPNVSRDNKTFLGAKMHRLTSWFRRHEK